MRTWRGIKQQYTEKRAPASLLSKRSLFLIKNHAFFLPFFNGAPLQHIGKQSKRREKKSRERLLAAFREWASEAVRQWEWLIKTNSSCSRTGTSTSSLTHRDQLPNHSNVKVASYHQWPDCRRNTLWLGSLERIWRNLNESGGICERKTLFWIKKKETDQAKFKGTQTGLYSLHLEKNVTTGCVSVKLVHVWSSFY